MLKSIYGFLMALADSVPGVSGGSIAYILGFYEEFIMSLNNIVSKDLEKRNKARRFLGELSGGWIIGIIVSMSILSTMFQNHIYIVSSLFLGFIMSSILLMVKDLSKETFHIKNIVLLVIGVLLVVSISLFKINGITSMYQFNFINAVYVFVIGFFAISAMVLPGISGSTILLICGVYLPVVYGVKSLLGLDFRVLPMFVVFGCGIVCGILISVKAIKKAYENHAVAFQYFIIGMLIGSLFAIVQGPTSMQVPHRAMTLSSFHIISFIIGVIIVVGLQFFQNISTYIKSI